jgi:hypothetical protein
LKDNVRVQGLEFEGVQGNVVEEEDEIQGEVTEDYQPAIIEQSRIYIIKQKLNKTYNYKGPNS